MAKMKHRAAIGRQDSMGNDLYVGDFIRTGADKVFQINCYGTPVNPVSGPTKWTSISSCLAISEEQYVESLKSSAATQEEEETAEESPMELLERVEKFPDAEELQEKKPERAFSLKDVSDDDIIAELRSRGYAGSMTKPVTTYITVEI